MGPMFPLPFANCADGLRTSPEYTGLRYHVQLFSDCGNSLLDYKRKRVVLSLGLSLVDWQASQLP